MKMKCQVCDYRTSSGVDLLLHLSMFHWYDDTEDWEDEEILEPGAFALVNITI